MWTRIFFCKTYSGQLASPSLVLFRVKCYSLTNGKYWSVRQRLKILIENTYHSWKVSRGLKELSSGGWGGGLDKVVYREAQSRGSYLFILHFIKRKVLLSGGASPYRSLRGVPPPPPWKYEKLPTCSSPPCRPLNFFIHSEVKNNLWNVFVLTLS